MERLDESHRETMAALSAITEELVATRKELTLTRIELTDAVNANREAIFKLIDRFDEWDGRPPGPPDLRSA
ncbi:MAG TPA: hypothetical protein VMF55_08945 [Solirubrobacterales bacterium]|nr:hypothetical protein [Solirubrobacterales bacterium]